jgi:hypothetical protein
MCTCKNTSEEEKVKKKGLAKDGLISRTGLAEQGDFE